MDVLSKEICCGLNWYLGIRLKFVIWNLVDWKIFLNFKFIIVYLSLKFLGSFLKYLKWYVENVFYFLWCFFKKKIVCILEMYFILYDFDLLMGVK